MDIYEFTWNIENFSTLLDIRNTLQVWRSICEVQMVLFEVSVRRLDGNTLVFKADFVTRNICNISNLKVSILNSDGSTFTTASTKVSTKCCEVSLCSQSDILKKRRDLLHEDVLTLRCTLSCGVSSALFNVRSHERTSDSADLTILAVGTQFEVHSSVVCPREPAFWKIVFEQIQSSGQYRVELEKGTATQLNVFLRYVYCDSICNGCISDFVLHLNSFLQLYGLDEVRSKLSALHYEDVTSTMLCDTTEVYIDVTVEEESWKIEFSQPRVEIRSMRFNITARLFDVDVHDFSYLEISFSDIKTYECFPYMRSEVSVIGVPQYEEKFKFINSIFDEIDVTLSHMKLKQNVLDRELIRNGTVKLHLRITIPNGDVSHEFNNQREDLSPILFNLNMRGALADPLLRSRFFSKC